MKKITVITLAPHQETTLHQLQDLGLLHIQLTGQEEHHTAVEVAEQVRAVHAVHEVLKKYAKHKPAETQTGVSIQDVVAKVKADVEQKDEIQEQVAELIDQIDELTVWGEFDPQRVRDLSARGLHVKLYRGSPQQIAQMPGDCIVHELIHEKTCTAFIVLARHPFTLDIPEVQLPDAPLSELKQRMHVLQERIAALDKNIAAFAGMTKKLAEYQEILEEDLARAYARDQLGAAGELAYLQGFCPVDRVADIEHAARQHGWGLMTEDPTADDQVPTLIRNPRWIRPVETVFNFIDTFPGYHERDICPVFYLFFSLFYAMLIGDACYGAIFLAATIAVHIWKRATIPRAPLYLFYVLNIATIIWGVIGGTYFGISPPPHSFLGKLVILNTGKFETMAYFCFIVATVHLLVAHTWNAIRIINSWRVISEICMILLVITMYFVANGLILGKPIPKFIYWAGGANVAVAYVVSCIGKRGEELVGAIIQFPFNVIGCFGDMASYIRLFAVGFASYAAAMAWNQIALQIGFNHVISSFFAAVILLLGHALNLVLGPLGVMVHGLRLNMLEFSLHLGQEWSGARYAPLRRRK